MHFVDKTSVDIPETLLEYKKTETYLWIEYYKRDKKTQKSTKPQIRWRENPIIEPLSNLFLNNCGYCGKATDIKSIPDKKYFTGQVDHYYPISRFPEKVYDWDNYIWSCSDCNGPGGKHSYYHPEILIFNPCWKEDMDCLIFDRIRGTYRLKKKYEKDMLIKKRFHITEEKTYINTDIRTMGRKKITERLEQFISDFKYYSLLKNCGIQEYEEEYQLEYNNTVKQLKQFINETTDFKFLVLELTKNITFD
jgi:hypothetical protein